MMLYFDAGAKEVRLCAVSGAMTFFRSGEAQPVSASQTCPEFSDASRIAVNWRCAQDVH
jgi:hypothetical protein